VTDDVSNPRDAAERVRASFERQRFMQTLGARLETVAAGEVEIRVTMDGRLTQQHGYLHAGVLAAVADSACGYAALTLMPENCEVVSVEFKINLLAPAVGRELIARARVVRAGRTVTVCSADVSMDRDDGTSRQVALMQATMMRVSPTS
jgi:uncharacterized protein (TIGR00369 family)